MTVKLPDFNGMISRVRASKTARENFRRDVSVGIAFVAAISILLLVAGYVINRLSRERAYREKWKDYNDCGWA